jgi:curved DNA-binding protein CbpA
MEHIAFYLRDIHFNYKSGRLVFTCKDIQKYFFFQDGYLVFTKTNQPGELLGEILFKMRKISQDVFSKIDQFIEPMQNLGKILVENGFITKRDLHAGLMYQMRETTLNIFPFFDGKFVFQEKSGFVEEEFGTRIDVPDLIEEGIRRMSYNPELKKFLENKIPLAKENVSLLRLTKEEKTLFGMLDGGKAAGILLRSAGFRSRPFWKALYLFYCLSLIDFEDEVKIPAKKKKAEKERPKVPRREKEEAKRVEDDDSRERLAEVLTLREKLSTMSNEQILGVSPTASQNEIKIAYFQLARKYHPDRFIQQVPSETRNKIDEVFGRITRAYEGLSKGEKIVDYEPRPEDRPEAKKEDLDRRAEFKFRQGRALYNQERYEEALVHLEEAVRIKKNKVSYIILLAMAEANVPDFRKKAEEDFLNAIELEPWNADAHAGLGLFYKKEGLLTKAEREFKKALEFEAGHPLVMKELSSDKKQKKSKIKEFLSHKLFEKKGKKD